MKKIITAAALIAASTALTNAATVLTTTFSNAAQTSATAVSLTNASDIADVSAGTASVTAGTNLLVTDSQGKTTAAGADATFYSPNANVGTGTSWTATFSYSDVSGITQIDSLTLDVGLFNSSGAWQSSSVTRYIDFTATIKSGETTLGTYSVSDYSITGKDSSNTHATVVLSGNTLSFANVSNFTVEFTVAKGASNGTNGTYVGLNSVAFNGSAIPEPSAFGLLAGIGALALAVSRRRRSR